MLAAVCELEARTRHEIGDRARHKDLLLKVMVAAVTSFELGLIVEGLSGVYEGHDELLAWIQTWLDSLEAAKRT